MFCAHFISILVMVTGTIQKATSQLRCQETQYYNEKENDCCFRCPQGHVTHSTCVKDIKNECVMCTGPNEFIDRSRNPPTCMACKLCRKESFLVEVQSCSLFMPAICECRPGYYCQTPVENSCARCNLFKRCPPGHGVKQKGSPKKDTECEACPSGTFSDVDSATETCKPHTDCKKCNQVTVQRGTVTTDTVCRGPKDPELKSRDTNTDKTTSDTTVRHTATPDITTSGPFTRTSNNGPLDPGEWSMVYVIATIICVISLLVAFFLSWKQNICHLKLWNFTQPELLRRTVITNVEENNEEELLRRENITPTTYQRTENTQNDWTMENKHEIQQERDQMNNRIEKIYIMNADTVLVGSISETSTRWRSATTECPESLPLASHYPEQESSNLSANDLMISIEEEERESCAAKALLEV
ncbi:tumor necrosis factor receptor superfamily member 1B-like [Bufo bufo]|uniref:tumor necrosis factor receptor superfamily member 1B-like n=1 Tax=Bufo bufo TaxID=8384 RepID=UPI001ABE4995|nr:tumor necrosis factor receptor superfamily member 1B-like [Bufo bufo]